MFAFPKLRFLVLAAGLFLSGVVAVSARSAYVEDNAGFFSEKARAQATRAIADLNQRVHREVVVETFAALPADLQKGVDLQDKGAVDRAVGQWAVKQIKSHDVDGVYILIVKSPSHLQIEVGPQTQRKDFTLADRDLLAKSMLAELHERRFDDALVNGVNLVATTMYSHEPVVTHSASSQPQPYDLRRAPAEHHWGWLSILIVILVVWGIFRLIGSLFRGGGSGGGMMTGTGYSGGGMMGPMSGGGGGGFFSSLVGGIFGAAAGSWMYDRFFGGSRETPNFDSQPDVRPTDDPGFGPKDTYDDSYTGNPGGGGDFGSSGDSGSSGSGSGGSGSGGSGGGDFGSSGDSGGGDSGGGGGDSGGGDSGGGGGGDF